MTTLSVLKGPLKIAQHWKCWVRHALRRESPGGYPNADAVMRGGLLLGCHQGMTDDQLDYMETSFTKFARRF